MIKRGVKLTAGLLVAALMVTTVPAEAFAGQSVKENDTIVASGSFSAGAHSAINESVVLNDTNIYFAGVTEVDVPVVAEANNPYANMGVAQVSEFVNVRAEADENAEVLGKLYNNGVATVLESVDGWYKITSGNVTGYVSEDFLVVGDAELCEAAQKRVGTITSRTSLKLREEASANGTVITSIVKGKTVTVLDESIEGWVKVTYKTYTGYVSADYISVETVCSYAESKEEETARLEAEAAARRAEEQRRREEEARREEERREEERREDDKKEEEKKEEEKEYTPPTGGSGQAVADYAVQFVGNPYVWGGTSLTNGADCSGFVQSVYKAFGVSLPRTSSQQRYAGYGVSASEIQPGDIVCYSGHVAIYIGNGKIVHASNRKDGIKISNNWQYRTVLAIRRIF